MRQEETEMGRQNPEKEAWMHLNEAELEDQFSYMSYYHACLIISGHSFNNRDLGKTTAKLQLI